LGAVEAIFSGHGHAYAGDLNSGDRPSLVFAEHAALRRRTADVFWNRRRPLPSERVGLEQSVGRRWLAEDLIVRAPLPGFDYSAMDGYAAGQ